MRTLLQRSFLFVFALALSLIPSMTVLQAQEEPQHVFSGVGSISFTMTGPESTPNITGNWTLIRPNNEKTQGSEKQFEFSGLPAGQYVFTTDLPQGTSAKITVVQDGKTIQTVSVPQVSISLDGDQNYTLAVEYYYSRKGIVSVNTEPNGVSFTLQGPNDSEWRGVTPASFQDVPEGQYSVMFDTIPGCPTLPMKSDRLVKDSRVTLFTNIVCDNLKDSDIGKQADRSMEFVTVTIDNRQVTFQDVRTSDWFAPFVFMVAKSGIISGYRDSNGNLEGRYGPSNNVTVAELAKIAHKVAGIDVSNIREAAQNTRAKGQWFEQYFASAESNWWEVWRDRRLDPSRSATRAEVVVTLLRALDVQLAWAKGNVFVDILPTDQYASAIETAGIDGLVDSGGAFRPNDPINRAELAKIISNAVDLYVQNTSEIQGQSY